MGVISARKQLIIQSAAIKINKVANNPNTTLEEIDAEVERHEKALTVLFGADEAEQILEGISEGLKQTAAASSFADSVMEETLKEAIASEMKSRKKKK